MGHVSSFDYQAIEPNKKVCRLANDRNGNVIIITKHNKPFSAPYKTALAGELIRVRDKLEIYKLSKEELKWVTGLCNFAKELESVK